MILKVAKQLTTDKDTAIRRLSDCLIDNEVVIDNAIIYLTEIEGTFCAFINGSKYNLGGYNVVLDNI